MLSDVWTRLRRTDIVGVLLCAFVLLAFVAPSDKAMMRAAIPFDAVYEGPAAVAHTLPLLFGMLVVLGGVALVRRGHEPPALQRWAWLFLGLLGIHVAWSIAVGLLRGQPTSYVLGNAQYLAAYVPMVALLTTRSARSSAVVGAFRWGFTIPALWTCLAFALGGFDRVSQEGARLIVDGSSFVIAGAALWLIRAHERRHPLAWFAAALCATTPLISGVRSVMVGMVLMVVVGLVLGVRGRYKPLVVLGGVCCVLAINFAPSGGGTAASSPEAQPGSGGLTGRDADQLAESSAVRREQAVVLYRAWREHPLAGQGYGYVADYDRPRDEADVPRPYITELSYNNELAKAGVIGMLPLVGGGLLFAWAVARWALSAHCRVMRASRGLLLGAVVGVAAVSLLNPIYESVYFHAFVALVLVTAGRDSPAEEESRSPHPPVVHEAFRLGVAPEERGGTAGDGSG